MELKDLHVETAGGKAEFEHAAHPGVALGVGRPPSAEAIDRGQCLIDVILGGRLDSDFVQYVDHG
jgi:hypothetical protein